MYKRQCTSSVEVTASTGSADNTESGHVGGLVGWNKGNISQCEATGNVFGGNSTGGFVGSNYGNASIYRSHAAGNVVGGYTTGGFAGSIGMGLSLIHILSYAALFIWRPMRFGN